MQGVLQQGRGTRHSFISDQITVQKSSISAAQHIPSKTIPLQNSDKASEGQPYKQHMEKL